MEGKQNVSRLLDTCQAQTKMALFSIMVFGSILSFFLGICCVYVSLKPLAMELSNIITDELVRVQWSLYSVNSVIAH